MVRKLVVIIVFLMVSGSFHTSAIDPQRVYGLSVSQHGISFSYQFDACLDAEVIDQELQILFTEFDYALDQPILPIESIHFGVPDGVTFDLKWTENARTTLSNVNPTILKDTHTTVSNASVQCASNEFPIVEITGEGWVRSQRIIGLKLRPIIYDADSQELQIIRRIDVSVTFEGEIGSDLTRKDPMGAHFEDILKGLLFNYNEAKQWRSESDPVVLSGVNTFDKRDETSEYKIEQCASPGIFRIDSQIDLIGKEYQNFEMFNKNDPTALRVVGVEDGKFDQGDYIDFFAVPMFDPIAGGNLYTDCNVYWFTIGDTAGCRYLPADATPGAGASVKGFSTTLRFEENRLPAYPEDKWMWSEIVARTNYPVTVNIPNPNIESQGNATITVHLYGTTSQSDVNPDHHARLYLNGSLIGQEYWDGLTAKSIVATIPNRQLRAGNNQIIIECPGDTGAEEKDEVWFNWITVEYERLLIAQDDLLDFTSTQTGSLLYTISGFHSNVITVLDVSHGTELFNTQIYQIGQTFAVDFEVSRTDPTRFVAYSELAVQHPSLALDTPSSLMDQSNQADYIIITHDELMSGIEPMVNLEQRRGYTVFVAEIQDIYDEFNFGIFNPEAIRRFLEYTYRYWTAPAPQLVLLAGEATWDYKGYLSQGVNRNLVPSYGKEWYANASDTTTQMLLEARANPDKDDYDFVYGEAMVDQQYVCISGNDDLPDMLLGRFGVDDLRQLSVMIDKSTRGFGGLPEGLWQKNLIFITGGIDTEEQLMLSNQSNMIIDRFVQPFNTGFNPVKIFKEVDGYDWGYYEQPIIDAMSRGALITTFFGHAGSWSWEFMLDFDDVPQINNEGRLPLVMSMTCNTVRFANPVVDSFGETLTNTGDPAKGALAVWGGCNFGGFWCDYYLAYSLYQEFFANTSLNVGSAILASKIHNLLTYPSYDVIIEPYTYLGDPALDIFIYSKPVIALGGYFDDQISSYQGGALHYLTWALSLDGARMQTVELYYDGIPTGVYLYDDGNNQDFSSNDGIFGLYVEVPPGLVAHDRYLIEAVGTNYFGDQTPLYPYLEVE